MSTLRVSAAIIWLSVAVMFAAYAGSASGLFTDSDPVGGNTFATAASFGGPTFRAAASAAAPSATLNLTISKPSGTVQNDTMVASISVRPDTATITAPAGWTLVRRIDNANPNANALAVYYKVAGASEPTSYTWTFSTSTGSAGGIQTFSGVDTTTPIDVEAGQNTANGLTHDTPSVNTTVANTMIVTSHGFTSSATWTPPGGMTEAFEAASQTVPATGGIAVEGNYVIQAATGATVAKTATASNDPDVGNAHILALKPGTLSSVVGILDGWTTGTTHTASAGTDRLLLVGVYGEHSGVISSINTVTWGGQTLTEINETTVGGGYSNLVWMGYLNDAGIAAASGSTIIATWSGATPDSSILYAAVTLENVDQTTPVGGSSTGTATSSSVVQISSSLSAAADDMAVYVTNTGETARTHTADTGYTEGTEQDSGSTGQVASNATKAITSNGNEQPTAAWSSTNNRLAIIGAVIKGSPLPAVGILDAWTTGTTHTVSAGTDRLLVFIAGMENGMVGASPPAGDRDLTAVSYGGQSLTPAEEVVVCSGSPDSFCVRTELWYLNEAGIQAATGSTFSPTWSGDPPYELEEYYTAVTLENVDQSSSIGDSSTNSTTAVNPIQTSSTLAVDARDFVVVSAVAGNVGSYTPGSGYTEGTDQAALSSTMASAHKAIAADGIEIPSMQFDLTVNRQAILAAVVNVAP